MISAPPITWTSLPAAACSEPFGRPGARSRRAGRRWRVPNEPEPISRRHGERTLTVDLALGARADRSSRRGRVWRAARSARRHPSSFASPRARPAPSPTSRRSCSPPARSRCMVSGMAAGCSRSGEIVVSEVRFRVSPSRICLHLRRRHGWLCLAARPRYTAPSHDIPRPGWLHQSRPRSWVAQLI